MADFDWNGWNRKVIEEFRANEGRVGGVGPDERDELYAEQAKRYPQFAGYQEKTSRKIPVMVLEP